MIESNHSSSIQENSKTHYNMPDESYAQSLRAIAQALDTLRINAFTLEKEGDKYIVRGWEPSVLKNIADEVWVQVLTRGKRVINWRNIAFCPVVVLWAVLGFAGCSSTVTQPESSSTTAANPPAESNTESAPTPIPAPSTSSLEAFQRGESTATPASSPLKEVYFEFDSYDLRADTRATLNANADWLRDNPSVAVEIEGHCDERGTNDYNMALGAKRAQAAMDYLTTLGVASSRLSTTSYGEELLVCEEHTEECWAKNRRDRFVIQPSRPAS